MSDNQYNEIFEPTEKGSGNPSPEGVNIPTSEGTESPTSGDSNRPASETTENPSSGAMAWLMEKWWIAPLVVLGLLLLVALFIDWFGNTEPTEWVYTITMLVGALSMVLLIVAAVACFVHKKIGRGIEIIVADIVLTGLVLMGGTALSMMAASAPEHFAKNHPIPQGMKLNDPLKIEITYPYRDTCYTADLLDTNDSDTWLQLNGGNGIYSYDLYYPALSDGYVFLRCFEATSGLPLSDEDIPIVSETSVRSHDAFGQVANMRQNEFTLYEGDFDEFYAVRVEAWHRDSLSGTETKLLEKLYRLDGWMR